MDLLKEFGTPNIIDYLFATNDTGIYSKIFQNGTQHRFKVQDIRNCDTKGSHCFCFGNFRMVLIFTVNVNAVFERERDKLTKNANMEDIEEYRKEEAFYLVRIYLKEKKLISSFVSIVGTILIDKPDDPIRHIAKFIVHKYPDETQSFKQ